MAALPTLVAATHRAGTWITPTLDCLENRRFWGKGHAQELPDIEVSRQIIKALQDADVGLLLGGDGATGKVHRELEALVRMGLTPYQSLLTGTRNVAQYFNLLDSSGTVAAGKWADLVLLAGNPLADIRHVREPAGVMVRGRWLDRATLDRGLLAFPKVWLGLALSSISPYRSDEQGKAGWFRTTTAHIEQFAALSDSLKLAPLSASEGLRQRLADELGALRALMTAEQQKTFDSAARVWQREQARQGSRVTVPGVTSEP